MIIIHQTTSTYSEIFALKVMRVISTKYNRIIKTYMKMKIKLTPEVYCYVKIIQMCYNRKQCNILNL